MSFCDKLLASSKPQIYGQILNYGDYTTNMTNLETFNPFSTRLLSKQQAAEILGVSISTLDRIMSAKSINFVRIGLRRIGFRREDIDEYISRNLDLPESHRTHKNASAIAA